MVNGQVDLSSIVPFNQASSEALASETWQESHYHQRNRSENQSFEE